MINYDETVTTTERLEISSRLDVEIVVAPFRHDFGEHLSGGARPNYFDLVTGGSTPSGLLIVKP